MTDDPFARVASALDESLFVEASAGTGKTKALVDRFVALVGSGVRVEEIVAITFTEKAAAELKDRIRSRLEELLRTGPGMESFNQAIESLDAAPISTIHAFAQGLVRSFSVEAGVDPDFDIVDEVAAERRFQQKWREQLEHFGQQEKARALFARVLRLGLLPHEIEKLAREIWRRHDLAARLLAAAVNPEALLPSGERRGGAEFERWERSWPDFDAMLATVRGMPIDDKEADDPLAVRLKRLRDVLELLAGTEDDAARESYLAAGGLAKLTFNHSTTRVWGSGKRGVVAAAVDIRTELSESLVRRREEALTELLPAVAGFVLEDRRARCREGALTFDDLISLARDVLAGSSDVVATTRDRHRTLLIDEFQDTDPWQFEIAHAFASRPEGGLEPGRLFLVGDPKQSIYRFRNADMAIYDRARNAIAAGDEPLRLVESRRSRGEIVDWVNAVFERVFDDGEPPVISPAYSPLVAVREDELSGPAVAVFGGSAPDGVRAPEVRRVEAGEVASTCRAIVDEGWMVVGRAEGADARRAGFRDIAILIPARTCLPDLERALESAGVPFRVESGSLVFQTQDVRDHVNILAAIDDPGNPVALVAALRSPAFACSDVDLARHRLAGGSFNYLRRDQTAGPVAEAMTQIFAYHERRATISLADLAQLVVGETGLVASAILDRADRDAFRRARFIVEQARAFEAEGPQPLRAFVDWLEVRGSKPIVDHEGAALDADEDAVRILTVHGAKGLEFPIVIMAGFGGNPPPPSWTYGVDPESHEVAVQAGAESRGTRFTAGPIEQVKALEKRHDRAEDARVLYVAATRARDHLVVSLHHSKRSTESGAATLVAAGAEGRAVRLRLPQLRGGSRDGALLGLDVELPAEAEAEQLEASRAAMIDGARRLRVTSATAMGQAAGLAKEARSDDTEPWSRGRDGTRLGRAVHAVIQSAPLDASEEVVRAFAAAQAVAEAIPDRAEDIARLARAGLGSEAASRARRAPRALREVPFAFTREETIVEGFIDMVIDDGQGLEVVDWKSDDIRADEIQRRMESYRLQAGLYVLGLEEATGRRVSRVTYVFLSAGVEHDLGETGALAEFAKDQLAALAPSPT